MSDKHKVDELRSELDAEKATDPVTNIAQQTQAMAQNARDQVAPQLEALESRIKERPIGAVLVAVGLGFVLGRITA